MMEFLEGFHYIARVWWHGMLRISLSITCVLGVAFVLVWLLRKFSPRYTSWCWRLAYLKLVIVALGVPSLGLPLLQWRPEQASTSSQKTAPMANPSPVRGQLVRSKRDVARHAQAPPRSPVIAKKLSNQIRFLRVRERFERWHPAPWLFVCWLCVVLGLIGARVAEWRRIRQMRRESLPLDDWTLQSAYQALCGQLQLTTRPQVRLMPQLKSPMLTGVWAPIIYLPVQAVSQCSPQALRLIFAHELAHYRHRDLFWQWLPGFLHIFFFFHPAVFFANRSWLLQQELHADEEALRITQDSAAQYGRLLLEFAQLQSSAGRVFATLGAYHSFRMLRERMEAMKYYAEISTSKKHTLAFLFVLVGMVGILPWHLKAAKAPYPAREKIVPNGWMVSGGFRQDYEVGIDRTVFYDGHASAYIRLKRAKQAKPAVPHRHFIGLRQSFRANPYLGQRVRLQGYLKTSHSQSYAFVTLRVHKRRELLTFGNTETTVLRAHSTAARITRGNQAWKRHEIVLDVPNDATDMQLSCWAWNAKGTLWCDAFRMDVVSKRVPITNGWFLGFRQRSPLPPRNLGFDTTASQLDQLSAWWLSGNARERWNFEIGVDSREFHSGHASAVVRSRVPYRRGVGTLQQTFAARAYRGKRIQLQAHLKQRAQGAAGLWLRIRDENQRTLAVRRSAPVLAPHPWTQVALFVDVSAQAHHIEIGCQLRGQGPLWCDTFQLKVIGVAKRTQPTMRHQRPALPASPQNLDFTAGTHMTRFGIRPLFWERWGLTPFDYEFGLSRKYSRKGGVSASLRLKPGRSVRGFAQMLQRFSARAYRGKRVRLTGYLKAQSARWFRLVMGSAVGRSSLQFARISPTHPANAKGWYRVQIVQYVPAHATSITIGCGLLGQGPLWCDAFQFEIVGDEVPLTSKAKRSHIPSTTRNLNFEQK